MHKLSFISFYSPINNRQLIVDGTGKMLRHKAGQEECRLEVFWSKCLEGESIRGEWKCVLASQRQAGRGGRKTMYTREGCESQGQAHISKYDPIFPTFPKIISWQ